MARETKAFFPVTSKICISLGYREAERLADEANQQALNGEELFEFRLDYLNEPEQGILILREFVGRYPGCKVIATFRITNLDEHLRILEYAIDAGAFAFDLEIECAERARDWFVKKRPGTRRILSYHNHECTPEMRVVVDRLYRIPADLYKIVSTAQKPTDNLAILNCDISRLNKPVVRFAMNEVGKASRILSLARNSPFTYAAPRTSDITAAGQLTCDELRKVYMVDRPTKVDQILAAIADSEIADQCARTYNLLPGRPEDLLHVPFTVNEHQLDDFLALAVHLPLRGFSIHGELQLWLADRIPKLHWTAQQTGRVDTVVNTGNGLTGIHVETIAKHAPSHNETTIMGHAGGDEAEIPNSPIVLIPPRVAAIQSQLWYGKQPMEPSPRCNAGCL
jgi:3-dehydroquinate dehydratase type I